MFCKNARSIPFIDAVSLEACPQKHALAPSLPNGTKLSFRLEAHESLSTESRLKVSEGTTSKDRIYFESYLAKGTAPDVPI